MADGELTIQHASRPRLLTPDKYNITYQDVITETPHAVSEPMLYQDLQLVDLVETPIMVFHNSGASRPDDDDFYTEWTTSGVRLDFDITNPVRDWYLYGDGGRLYMNCDSPLPSGYTIVSFNHLYAGGNWRGQLLYTMENGIYVVTGAMFALSNGGTRCSLYYDVDLMYNSTGETINRTGNTIAYSVSNSPFTTQMALYVPTSSFSGRGNVKCEVTMTETPAN